MGGFTYLADALKDGAHPCLPTLPTPEHVAFLFVGGREEVG